MSTCIPVKRARSEDSDEEASTRKERRGSHRTGLVGVPMPDGLMARIDAPNSRVEILDARRTVYFDETGIDSYFVVGGALFFTTRDGLNMWSRQHGRRHVSADGQFKAILSGAIVTRDNCVVTPCGIRSVSHPTLRVSTKHSLDLDTPVLCWWHDGPVLSSMCLTDGIVHTVLFESEVLAIVPDGPLCDVKLGHATRCIEYGSGSIIKMESPFPTLASGTAIQITEADVRELEIPLAYLHGDMPPFDTAVAVFGVDAQCRIYTLSYCL